MAAQAFHCFQNLPLELQIIVLEHAREERSRDYVQIKRDDDRREISIFYGMLFVSPRLGWTFHYGEDFSRIKDVCRLARLVALQALRREYVNTPMDPDEFSSMGGPLPLWRQRRLVVLDELIEEVKARLEG